MTSRRTLWTAALASFLVYLIPTIGPHALFTVGGVVVSDLTLVAGKKELAWIASDIGFALALQALAFGLLVWTASGRHVRWLVVVPCVVLSVWAANLAYMVVIPTHFLLEADSAPEQARWPVACTVSDASLVRVRSGADLALTHAGEVWVQQEPEGRYGVLGMPDCLVHATRHRRSGTATVDYVAPGARVLHRVRDASSNVETHWFDAGDGSASRPIPKPSEKWWNPTLSADAKAIAWIESEPGARGRRPEHRVVTRDITSGAEQRFTIPQRLALARQILSLGEADPAHDRQVLLFGGDNVLAAFDSRGRQIWGPLRTGDVNAGFDAVRRLGQGWVAWDGYRENGPYRVHWSLARGHGHHQVLKGRSINDVAVDAAGRYLAISVTNALNLGSVDDALYVLRVENGMEVYRRYFPRFNRTPVAFISSEFLVFHGHETVGDRVQGTVHVVRLPGPGAKN